VQLIAIDSSFMRCMQVSDAVELASSLRVQLVRERKQADTRSHEAHTAMALADERARALQRQLEALSRANGAAQGGAAQDARAAVASEVEAVPPLPALKSDVGSCADLDKRLAQIKAKHAAAPSFALPIAPPPAPRGAAEAAAVAADGGGVQGDEGVGGEAESLGAQPKKKKKKKAAAGEVGALSFDADEG
jgi:hypothetical protein